MITEKITKKDKFEILKGVLRKAKQFSEETERSVDIKNAEKLIEFGKSNN